MITNYKLNDSYENYYNTQVENGNAALETAALFMESPPYIVHTNIFGVITYEWSDDFMDNMSKTLASGEYSNKFSKAERLLAEQYIDFKFGSGATNSVISALDTELGD